MYLQPQRDYKSAKRRTRAGSRGLRTRTCLITGFDSFGNNPFNPCEPLVQSLPDQIDYKSGELLIRSAVLPTCCIRAWTKLRAMMRKTEPDVVLLTGLAQRRERLSLERFALNVRDYRIADNEGHLWQDKLVEPHGPDAIRCYLPLAKIRNHLIRKGYPCEISSHGGTFVCNEIYYHALNYHATQKDPLVLFVHLPLPERFGETLAQASGKTARKNARERERYMSVMMEGVLEIARFCANLP
jgi:pyroglutamyl-peptidase